MQVCGNADLYEGKCVLSIIEKISFKLIGNKKSVLRCATTKRTGLRSPFRLSGWYD